MSTESLLHDSFTKVFEIVITQLMSNLGLKSRFPGYNYDMMFTVVCQYKIYKRTLERGVKERIGISLTFTLCCL